MMESPNIAPSHPHREILTADAFYERIHALAAASPERCAELWDVEIQDTATLFSDIAKRVVLGRCLFPQGLQTHVERTQCHDCHFGSWVRAHGHSLSLMQCAAEYVESRGPYFEMDEGCSIGSLFVYDSKEEEKERIIHLYGNVQYLTWHTHPALMAKIRILDDSAPHHLLRVREWIRVSHPQWLRYFQAAFPSVPVIYVGSMTEL